MNSTNPNRWVFLRGLARSQVHWGDFEKHFRKRFSQDELFFLDAAGNGNQSHLESYSSIEQTTEDLRSRALSAGIIDEQVQVKIVSISLGGMIAAEWASRYPQDVSHLYFINTSDKGTSSFYQRLRPNNYLKILSLLAKTDDQTLVENQILDMTTNLLSAEQKQIWTESFAKFPLCSRSNFFKQLLSAAKYKFPKTKPKMPILFLASQSDRLVSSQCSEAIADTWKCPLVLHPTAGHDLPLDDPEWVLNQLGKI